MSKDDKALADTQSGQAKEIEELKKFIATAEESLESAKNALTKLTGEDILKAKKGFKPSSGAIAGLNVSESGTIIEGIFDGENMVGPEEKIYPVPANYASKSKLVEGDKLKLTVAEDGSFIFKQIGPTERKKLIGTLSFDDNMFHVLAEGKTYSVLYASVTYFKAKVGDRVTIVVPDEGVSEWGALENIIHDVKEQKEEPKENKNPLADLPEFPNVDSVSEQNDKKAAESVYPDVKMEEVQSETTSPDESFLPRQEDEISNALGENTAAGGANADSTTTELEI